MQSLITKAQAQCLVQDHAFTDIFHRYVLCLDADCFYGSLQFSAKIGKNCYCVCYLLPNGNKGLFLYDAPRRRMEKTLFKDTASLISYLDEVAKKDTQKIKRKSRFTRMAYRYCTHWWWYFKNQGYSTKEEN